MKPCCPAYSTVSRLAFDAMKTGGCGLVSGAGNHAHTAHFALRADFSRRAELCRPVGHEPVAQACVMGVRNLPAGRVVLDAVLGPRLEHDLDCFLENLAIEFVIGAAVGPGCPRAEMLPEHVRPAGLETAREPYETPAFGQMVEHRRFLGDPDRVVGGHHVAELSHPDVFGPRPPEGVHHAGTWADFIPFGMEVVLDCRHAPQAEAVRLFHDIAPASQGFLEALGVPAYGSQGHPLGLGGRRNHRIHLDDNFNHVRFPGQAPRGEEASARVARVPRYRCRLVLLKQFHARWSAD